MWTNTHPPHEEHCVANPSHGDNFQNVRSERLNLKISRRRRRSIAKAQECARKCLPRKVYVQSLRNVILRPEAGFSCREVPAPLGMRIPPPASKSHFGEIEHRLCGAGISLHTPALLQCFAAFGEKSLGSISPNGHFENCHRAMDWQRSVPHGEGVCSSTPALPTRTPGLLSG